MGSSGSSATTKVRRLWGASIIADFDSTSLSQTLTGINGMHLYLYIVVVIDDIVKLFPLLQLWYAALIGLLCLQSVIHHAIRHSIRTSKASKAGVEIVSDDVYVGVSTLNLLPVSSPYQSTVRSLLQRQVLSSRGVRAEFPCALLTSECVWALLKEIIDD